MDRVMRRITGWAYGNTKRTIAGRAAGRATGKAAGRAFGRNSGRGAWNIIISLTLQ